MYKTAAVLTIRDAAKMSVQGKKDIAEWLRRQADSLMKSGHIYSKGWRARYQYSDRVPKPARKQRKK